MPRVQNFNTSVIYHIRHIETKNVIYVGSTTNFPQRKRQHKYDCNNTNSNNYNYPTYQYIRNNRGWEQYEVIPIKCFSCNNKNELLLEEQQEIDRHDTLINQLKCHTGFNNIQEYQKHYREEHKEEAKEYHKQYRDNNKEILKQKKHEYYNNNRERLQKYHKDWYEINKQKQNEKRAEIVTCECGCVSTIGHLSRHKKTKKHLEIMETK